MAISDSASVHIQDVWAHNLEEEFSKIRDIIDDYPYVAVDTEFPGVVFGTRPLSSCSNYQSVKDNVDNLKLIQVGFTFTDAEGHLPRLRCGDGDEQEEILCSWQFNFRDFDVRSDMHAPMSIELLRESGMDFERNRCSGVDTVAFAECLMSSGIVLNRDVVQFMSFHGSYDYAYLLKILTGKGLPNRVEDFMDMVYMYFGTTYDVKHIMHVCGTSHGGLNRLAQDLGLKRYGASHQAGSDSLLTAAAFHKLKDSHVDGLGGEVLEKCCGVLYGLTVSGKEPLESKRQNKTGILEQSFVLGSKTYGFVNGKQPIVVY